MPRDVEPTTPTVTEDLKSLVEILRGEPLPNWDFSTVTHCALGLFESRFGHDRYLRMTHSFEPYYFGEIFGAGSCPTYAHQVTPDIVANRIEKYLAAH